MHPIFIQTFYYAVVLILALGFIGLLQKGFFWKFIKVKLSFGSKILVKVKAIDKDFYSIGRIEEGFLVYKAHKEEKKISIKEKQALYRSLGINWLDVDDEKNCIYYNNKAVDGFDAIKYNDLYKRALYKPEIASNKDRIMMGLLIGLCIGVMIIAYIVYKQNNTLFLIQQSVNGLKGVVSSIPQRVPI